MTGTVIMTDVTTGVMIIGMIAIATIDNQVINIGIQNAGLRAGVLSCYTQSRLPLLPFSIPHSAFRI